jgi:hypothetical protein
MIIELDATVNSERSLSDLQFLLKKETSRFHSILYCIVLEIQI